MIYKIFCICILLLIVILNTIIILDSNKTKEKLGKIEFKVHDHPPKEEIPSFTRKEEIPPPIYISEKNIKVCNQILEVPGTIIERGLMTDIEIKERLLKNMTPYLLENLEIIEERDFIKGKFIYTGRIRVI